MPQPGRKVPFSGKKKKLQILKKRQLKNQGILQTVRKPDESDENEETSSTASATQKINFQNLGRVNSNRRRYALQFHKESKKELELMKQESRNAIVRVPIDDLQIDGKFFDGYDFPTRPAWSYDMSREELDRNENRYFTDYVVKLEKQHAEENKHLSLFELNLETWRQLWRVLEMSDILLIIVDIRYTTLMFPPALYKHIVEKLRKNVILVLNKVDLVPADVVIAWKYYFMETCPGISIVVFTSYPAYSSPNEERSLKLKRRCIARKISAAGAQSIYMVCKNIVGKALDISKWEQKIMEDMDQASNALDDDEDEETQNSSECLIHEETYEFNFEEREKYKDGILTIGCIGFPNVGKSSIINALKGRKIVSVSKTPGHTKHFQTIFLTENVKLCDCPGLVFPSCTPKHLQVLLGSYPVAQLREPYFSIKYLAERIDLPKILNLQLSDEEEWSAIALCEAWAQKKGFITAKAGRPDTYRAANNILRLALEGKIVLKFYPPKYFEDKEKWTQHEEIEEVKKVQIMEKPESIPLEEQNVSSSEIPSDSEDDTEKDETTGSSDNEKDNQNVFAVLAEE